MDEGEYWSYPYQQVYQYVRRYMAGFNLDSYTFEPDVDGHADDGSSPEDFLDLTLSLMYKRYNYTVDFSILTTHGTSQSALISGMASFQGSICINKGLFKVAYI